MCPKNDIYRPFVWLLTLLSISCIIASSTTTSKKEPVLNSDGEEESEAPAYRDMFRDALFSVTPVHVPNKKGGGKKKNKGQLLFATGGQRKY